MSTWSTGSVDCCSLPYIYHVTWIVGFTHFGIIQTVASKYGHGECYILIYILKLSLS